MDFKIVENGMRYTHGTRNDSISYLINGIDIISYIASRRGDTASYGVSG